MAHKALGEVDGQKLLTRLLNEASNGTLTVLDKYCGVEPNTDFTQLLNNNPWLGTEKLVVKVGHLIKRRGINNLIALDVTFEEAKAWINERMNKEVTIDGVTGVMSEFIISQFIPHKKQDEYYCAIQTERDGDEILFFEEGGIDVGDVDAKAKRVKIGVWDTENVNEDFITKNLLKDVPAERQPTVAKFLSTLYKVFAHNGFAYLEINPIAFIGDAVVPLDLAAKLDDTAYFECKGAWGDISFPAPFGRASTEAEKFVERLDANSGASLKLSVLNPEGRIWTLVAGGGASVIYADTVADLGHGPELANYGEYSGNPSEGETCEYAKTVLDLMTKQPDPQGREKVLIIGGGIANFTDVSKTFNGIIRALEQYQEPLKKVNARIYVRRGGPNYKEGLAKMEKVGERLGIPIEVYGPETHMTRIVKMALAA